MLKNNAVQHIIPTFYLIKREVGVFHRIVYFK